jgi:uncharacterized membrane protein
MGHDQQTPPHATPAPPTARFHGLIDEAPSFAVGRVEQANGGVAVRWQLRRNCSLRPMQLLVCVLVVCGVSGFTALMFWGLGYGWVSMFLLLQMGAVVSAAWVYARHACDHDTVTLKQGRLIVEQCSSGSTQRTELYAPFVRVDVEDDGRTPICLTERSTRLQVGRYVSPHVRQRVVVELQRALRLA